MFMINFRDRENVKPDVPLEPLNLEHFVLPFIFLAVGLREVRARRKFSTDCCRSFKVFVLYCMSKNSCPFYIETLFGHLVKTLWYFWLLK